MSPRSTSLTQMVHPRCGARAEGGGVVLKLWGTEGGFVKGKGEGWVGCEEEHDQERKKALRQIKFIFHTLVRWNSIYHATLWLCTSPRLTGRWKNCHQTQREREQSAGGVGKGIGWSTENNIERAPILIQSIYPCRPLFCVGTAPPTCSEQCVLGYASGHWVVDNAHDAEAPFLFTSCSQSWMALIELWWMISRTNGNHREKYKGNDGI